MAYTSAQVVKPDPTWAVFVTQKSYVQSFTEDIDWQDKFGLSQTLRDYYSADIGLKPAYGSAGPAALRRARVRSPARC